MTRFLFTILAVAIVSCLVAGDSAGPRLQLVGEVQRISDRAPHSAFTDLLHVDGHWFCVFREGTGHAAGAGVIRVLTSTDGKNWQSVATLAEEGVDLRDPHICRTPDGRLMINGGAAVPPTRDPVKDHYSWVSFSKDGKEWSRPQRVLEPWQWLWRVTWHKGTAYGVAYSWDREKTKQPKEYRSALYRSPDGVKWEKVADFDLINATEATVRFDGDTMLCLHRRDGNPNTAQLGTSQPPYTEWQWKDLGFSYGGPNCLQAPDGTWWAVGRKTDKAGPKTVLCRLDIEAGQLLPVLTLPSGGDTSYAGLAWHAGELWVSYYSSHEEKKSRIYLARTKVIRTGRIGI